MACGQCALARVSYLESTRAKAQQNSTAMDPFYSGAWPNFAPGLTGDPQTTFYHGELEVKPDGTQLLYLPPV